MHTISNHTYRASGIWRSGKRALCFRQNRSNRLFNSYGSSNAAEENADFQATVCKGNPVKKFAWSYVQLHCLWSVESSAERGQKTRIQLHSWYMASMPVYRLHGYG